MARPQDVEPTVRTTILGILLDHYPYTPDSIAAAVEKLMEAVQTGRAFWHWVGGREPVPPKGGWRAKQPLGQPWHFVRAGAEETLCGNPRLSEMTARNETPIHGNACAPCVRLWLEALSSAQPAPSSAERRLRKALALCADAMDKPDLRTIEQCRAYCAARDHARSVLDETPDGEANNGL